MPRNTVKGLVMADRRASRTTSKAIEDLKARQRNVVFPEVLNNSRWVDAFLWKGSPNAPLVQRAGAWIFGLFFMLAGLAILALGLQKQSWQADLFALVWFLLGGRIFLNGCRWPSGKRASHK
jgi:hypothetical protein